MILIKLETYPRDFELKRYEVARLVVANNLVESQSTGGKTGGYDYQFRVAPDRGEVWKEGGGIHLESRSKKGVWDILYKCLKDAETSQALNAPGELLTLPVPPTHVLEIIIELWPAGERESSFVHSRGTIESHMMGATPGLEYKLKQAHNFKPKRTWKKGQVGRPETITSVWSPVLACLTHAVGFRNKNIRKAG